MRILSIPHLLSRHSAARAFAANLVLVLCAMADRPSHSTSSSSAQLYTPSAVVEPNHTLERAIAAHQQHLFAIHLRSGQYARLELEHPGVRLAVSVANPDGSQLLKYTDRRRVRLSVSLIARSTGSYSLLISSSETEDEGRYRLSLPELRDVLKEDAEDIQGERSFEEAERLTGDYALASYNAAILKYKEAAVHWGMASDKRRQAAAFLGLGEVLTRLSDRKTADQNFSRALEISRAIEDKSGLASALNHLAYNYIESNQVEKGLELSNTALSLSRAVADHDQEGWALFNAGYANETRGDKKSGLARYQEALDVFQPIPDRRGQAHTLTFMGLVRLDMGDLPGARDCLEKRALPLWQAIGNPWGKALAENALALVFDGMGERQSALDYDRESTRLFHSIGDREHEGVSLNSMGYLSIKMGQLDEAYQDYNRSLRIFQSTGSIADRSVAIARIGKIHELKGEDGLALQNYRRYLMMVPKSTNPRAYVLQWIGDVYAHTNLALAMQYYERALRIRKSVNEPRGLAQTLNCIGFILYRKKSYPEALDHYQEARSIQQSVKDREGESATLYNIALAERDSGDLSHARSSIDLALAINEALRRQVASKVFRASYVASVHQRYELCTDILMRLYKRNHSNEFLASAFESSENGRARSGLETLVEAQAGIKQGVDSSLLASESELLERLGSKEDDRIGLLSNSLDQRTADPSRSKALNDQAAEVGKDIDFLNAQYDALQERMRLTSPAYAALKYPRPPSLTELQQRDLDQDTALFEYELGEDRSFLWTITSNRIKGYELPPRAVIEGLAHRVYLSLSDPDSTPRKERVFWSLAARLSAMVLRPAASELSKERIVVVADGALQFIPFGVLPDPTPSSVVRVESIGPMVIRHEVTYLPSAAILEEIRQELARRKPAPLLIAVLADPIFEKDDARLAKIQEHDKEKTASNLIARLKGILRSGKDDNAALNLPALPGTEDEAKAVIELVPDERQRLIALGLDASRERALDPILGQYKIIDFATHALVDTDQPERSGLVLSMVDAMGRPHYGVVTLRDIYSMKLSADLVVLSACNTALGKDIKGEGLVGLTRGFMYAGSARVVSSLWKVDDNAVAELMACLYKDILKNNESPAAALRAAQVEMWEHSTWKSPRYWGAFALQGEWR